MITAPTRLVARLATGVAAAAGLAALLIGPPWGLIRFVGWPLPDHVPTGADLLAWLETSLSDNVIIDLLACACWVAWALFVLNVLAAVIEHGSGRSRLPAPPGPQRALAVALVTGVAFALLGNRLAGAPTDPGVATAHQRHPITRTVAVHNCEPHPDTVIVRPPRSGTHDSLSLIAQQELGNGNRWPVIYDLNRGTAQPDGRSLHDPDLIQPGWVLQLPDRTAGTPCVTAPPSAPMPAPATPTDAPTRPPNVDGEDDQNETQRRDTGGVEIPPGAYVATALTASVAAAASAALIWRRRRYRPGSGDRSDLSFEPVIEAMRTAAPQYEPPPPDEREVGSAPEHTIGTRDGEILQLDPRANHCIGLVGPGAVSAARAMLISWLTQATPDGQLKIIIPAVDVETLLGDEGAADLQPFLVQVVPDLDHALNALQVELVRRTRISDAATSSVSPLAPLMLVASTTAADEPRIRAILDQGAALGITAILLGAFDPAHTARVRADGTVGAVGNDLEHQLGGCRLFNLPAPDASAVLQVLAEAAGRRNRATAISSVQVGERGATDLEIAPTSEATVQHDGQGSPPGDEAPHDPDQHALNERADASAAKDSDGVGWGSPQPVPPLSMRVLGDALLARTDGASQSQQVPKQPSPKHWEILLYLALNGGWASKETITAKIWPGKDSTNTFHATLSHLRGRLGDHFGEDGDVVIPESGRRYRLNPEMVNVDLWRMNAALRACRSGPADPNRQATALAAIELYRGELAADLPDIAWLAGPRQEIRRTLLDTISAIIRHRHNEDPDDTLALLEEARRIDPCNELIYRDIARTQARLKQYDAISRTLDLLAASLESTPSKLTVELCARLQDRGHQSARHPMPIGRESSNR